MMLGYPMMAPTYPMLMPGTGSIRSVQSVPMLSPPAHTWDGEPCPVHHHGPHHPPMVPLAALYGENKTNKVKFTKYIYKRRLPNLTKIILPIPGMGGHPGMAHPGYPASMAGMSLAYSVPPSVVSGATTVRRARSTAELSQAPPGHPASIHQGEEERRCGMENWKNVSS